MEWKELRKPKNTIPLVAFIIVIITKVVGLDVDVDFLKIFGALAVILVSANSEIDDLMEKKERIEKIKQGLFQ